MTILCDETEGLVNRPNKVSNCQAALGKFKMLSLSTTSNLCAICVVIPLLFTFPILLFRVHLVPYICCLVWRVSCHLSAFKQVGSSYYCYLTRPNA